VRDLQKALKARGLNPSPPPTNPHGSPAYFMRNDPDGTRPLTTST